MTSADGAGAVGKTEKRRRRIGIAVTALLLVLTAIWCCLDRDTYPAYPAAPSAYHALIAGHLRAEAALPLGGEPRGAR